MDHRYWIAWTTDGWATLIRRLPGREREVWVTDGPQVGDVLDPPRLARRPRPAEVGRLDAERFVLQRLPDVTFLDEGDPQPPGPMLDPALRPGWGAGRFMRCYVLDRWVSAAAVGVRTRTPRSRRLLETVRVPRVG